MVWKKKIISRVSESSKKSSLSPPEFLKKHRIGAFCLAFPLQDGHGYCSDLGSSSFSSTCHAGYSHTECLTIFFAVHEKLFFFHLGYHITCETLNSK